MPLILLVEDHEDTLEIYRTIFSLRGHETVEARDGATGLRLALERTPALIILDIGLPGMDGWTVLENLRGDPRGESIPVLVVTAHADPEERPRVERSLCDRILLKPVDPFALLEAAEACLEGGR